MTTALVYKTKDSGLGVTRDCVLVWKGSNMVHGHDIRATGQSGLLRVIINIHVMLFCAL
jgi:hypothetical protein